MRLEVPMCKLPLRFDVGRLVKEVTAFEPSEWVNHPGGFEPSRNLILISVGGTSNDDFAAAGKMKATPALKRCPYTKQVLASFGAPISRARFTSIDGPAHLPSHEDANYHWFTRTRIHVPIVTAPAVKFVVEDQREHMAAGEAWIFDNFRRHSVENPVSLSRIHLILDTSGSPFFWSLVKRAIKHGPEARPAFIAYDKKARAVTEIDRTGFSVPTRQQVDQLVADVLEEIPSKFPIEGQCQVATQQLEMFRQSWATAYSQFGSSRAGLRHYAAALLRLQRFVEASQLKRRLNRYGTAYGSLAVLSSIFQATNRTVDYDGKLIDAQVAEGMAAQTPPRSRPQQTM